MIRISGFRPMDLAAELRARGVRFPSRVLNDGSVGIESPVSLEVSVTSTARGVRTEAVESEASKSLQASSSQYSEAWEDYAAQCILEFWPGLRAPRGPEPET